jgi:hypothetical protein
LSPSALFLIYYTNHQHANIREKDGWYKEDEWKGMLRMILRAECRMLGIHREIIWNYSLASCLISPNDPPRALFI